jgi:hypothetical protein
VSSREMCSKCETWERAVITGTPRLAKRGDQRWSMNWSNSSRAYWSLYVR